MRIRSQASGKLVTEAAAFGLGYTAVLVWIGSALVGSFGSDGANPYWPAVPQLRTDTAGALAFAVATVTLVLSKYLELRRSDGVPAGPVPRPAGVLAVQAAAETAMFLSTAIVIYLSCNAFMHPVTLRMQLTHLLPWPTEGTVRVIALGVCLVSVAAHRYLRATATRPGQVAPVREKAGVAA